MNKKRHKKNVKKNLKNIFNSYKTIIVISFIINIILLVFAFYTISNNKLYAFSGKDDYIEVKDGIIALNNDINLINNNNVKYINSVDYDIKSYKIGYSVMDGTKLIEIISNSLDLDTEIKLSEVINNFASFNITEKNKNNEYFTYKKKKLINDGLYLIIEAKTSSGEQIVSNIKLNVTKISKY